MLGLLAPGDRANTQLNTWGILHKIRYAEGAAIDAIAKESITTGIREHVVRSLRNSEPPTVTGKFQAGTVRHSSSLSVAE